MVEVPGARMVRSESFFFTKVKKVKKFTFFKKTDKFSQVLVDWRVLPGSNAACHNI